MYIISTVWPHNVYLQLLYFLLVSLRLSFCDIRDNYLTSLASIYTLGTAWVEQYTVFWDVLYVVLKVTLSTLGNRYEQKTRVLLYEKVAAVFAPIWQQSREANPLSEYKAFHKHVATTCTLSNKLNIKILSGYSQLTIFNYIFLQCLKFSALLVQAIFPQWLS